MLNDEIKEYISKDLGIPYEKLIEMDDDEITAYIEQKIGKKLGYDHSDYLFTTGSGDDSVLIDLGRFTSIEEVDKKMDEIIKQR